jgi:GlcNAc-P-P-Und epimerase
MDLSDKKVFVTGGSGFIGTNLIELLTSKGVDVLNFDIIPPRNKAQNKFWVKGDLLDSEKLKSSVESFNPDYIVHSAARTDLNGSTIDDYRVNTVGVSNLIDSLQCSKSLKRILYNKLLNCY